MVKLARFFVFLILKNLDQTILIHQKCLMTLLIFGKVCSFFFKKEIFRDPKRSLEIQGDPRRSKEIERDRKRSKEIERDPKRSKKIQRDPHFFNPK